MTGGRGRPPGGRIADIVLGLAVLAIAIVFGLEARRAPEALYDPVGPGAVPMAVAGLLAALSLVLVLRALAGRDSGRSVVVFIIATDTGLAEQRPFRTAAMVGLTIAYVLLMSLRSVPYALSTAVFVFTVSAILGERTRRALAVAGVVAAATGGVVQLLFKSLLQVDIP